jgi:hypothetical protein
MLPGDEQRDLWISDGKISFEPVPGAQTLVLSGFLVPGLVTPVSPTALRRACCL